MSPIGRRRHPIPRSQTPFRGASRPGIALGVLLVALMLAVPAALQAQPVDTDTVAPATDTSVLDELFWVDRSSSLLSGGSSEIAVWPARTNIVFAGGRGFVARSEDAGVTWTPVLLLVGSDLATTDTAGSDQIVVRVDPDDLDAFEEADALDRFDQLRDEALEELETLYGSGDYAEELLEDLEGDLREEAFGEIIDRATEAARDEADYQQRYQNLLTAGLSEDDATALAVDPLTVYQILIDPAQTSTLYVATGLGLFRSTDDGRTWQRLLMGIDVDRRGVLSVAVANNGQTILAGTVGGLRVSQDAGRTWSSTTGGLSDEPIADVAAASSAGRFYASGRDGISRTEDGGLTWLPLNPVDFDGTEVTRLVTVEGWSDTLLVATTRGLYRSDDAGQSFTDIGRTLASRDLLDVVLPQPGNPDVLLALAERRVYLTRDNGNNWVDASSGLLGQELRAGSAGGLDAIYLATTSGPVRGLLGEAAVLASESVRQLRAIWDAEPSPGQTLWAALTYNGLAEIPTESWQTRQFSARFLPQVRAEVDILQERIELERVTFELPDTNTQPTLEFLTRQYRYARPRTEVEFRVLAWWDLGRILYDPAEHSIESVGLQLMRARRRLAVRVMRLIAARRALQMRLASDVDSGLDGRLDGILELEESTALLDGLTGGFYSAATVAGP